MNGLMSKIHDFIEQKYKICFTGKIKVVKEKNIYTTNIVLNSEFTPIVIYSEHDSDDDYYDYITKEIIKRNLIKVDFFKLKLEHGKIGLKR